MSMFNKDKEEGSQSQELPTMPVDSHLVIDGLSELMEILINMASAKKPESFDVQVHCPLNSQKMTPESQSIQQAVLQAVCSKAWELNAREGQVIPGTLTLKLDHVESHPTDINDG